MRAVRSLLENSEVFDRVESCKESIRRKDVRRNEVLIEVTAVSSVLGEF